MTIPKEALLLRVYLGHADRHGSVPLYEAIVLKAREAGLAGATVLRGPLGFGASSRLHSAKILRLSVDLPVVVEIVDGREKIEAFLPLLDALTGPDSGVLVTLEEIAVHRYSGKKLAAS